MPRTADKRGRSLTKGTFAQLPETVMASAAYATLSLPGRAVLFELARLYRGGNNGRLGLSCRQAAERLQCSKDTAGRAFRELVERCLVESSVAGRFDAKGAQFASEWRLTWRKCDRTGALPSHGYRNFSRSDGRDATVRCQGP